MPCPMGLGGSFCSILDGVVGLPPAMATFIRPKTTDSYLSHELSPSKKRSSKILIVFRL
jgi:hypothetical protein